MTGSRQDAIDLGSDMDEDEALRYAITLSLQEQEVQDQQSSRIPDASTSTSRRNGTGSGGASSGLLALDRKQMEEERLQRLAKRRRSPSDDEDIVEVPPPKRRTPADPPGALSGSSSPSLPPYPYGTVKRTWARGYPRTSEDIKIEEVFQKDKLELAVLSSYQWDDEWLMSKLDLRKTKLLLLAYAADEAQKTAMRSNVPSGIKFCFPAMNGPGAMHSKLQLLKYPDYLRVVVPTANLVPYDWGETGVMENMVFLIDLPRIGDSARHQPTVFSTELGRFLSATGVEATMVSSLANYDFSQTTHLGFVYSIPGGHLGDSLKRVGYCGLGASVASLGLATDDPVEVDFVVGAMPAHLSDPSTTTWWAQCTMPVEVRRHGLLCTPLPVHPTYGTRRPWCGLTAKDGLTRDIGDDGMAEYKSRIGRTGAAAKDKSSSLWQPKLKDRFRIYFPTDETVGKSRGGRMVSLADLENWRILTHMRIPLALVTTLTREARTQAAGTICVQPKWWRSSTFPTELVRDCVNTREGLLMHSKMIFVRRNRDQFRTQSGSQTRLPPRLQAEPRGRDQRPTGGGDNDPTQPNAVKTSPGWSYAYVGSANLSESAWGRIVKDRATGQPKMSCRNWESGVVVRVSSIGSNSSAVSVSLSGSTKVKAAEAQAQAQAGNPSGEPDKGGDTSKPQELVTDMGIFDGTVPVPMRLPARRYRAGEEPWFYNVQG
ncbi:hypothetical protein FZEAL_7611 [Fusarium zealandicum]|uniref:Tyrosyl-DNA phosphodiesterase 1 n=1 Tax=Fusarium zealandicum TaxID=1053134 RepID=A0A8H4UFJ4_9HYPO|nr:hypothetical protein FZEAL_7611 [Fusarium zealandicum]